MVEGCLFFTFKVFFFLYFHFFLSFHLSVIFKLVSIYQQTVNISTPSGSNFQCFHSTSFCIENSAWWAFKLCAWLTIQVLSCCFFYLCLYSQTPNIWKYEEYVLQMHCMNCMNPSEDKKYKGILWYFVIQVPDGCEKCLEENEGKYQKWDHSSLQWYPDKQDPHSAEKHRQL